MKTIDLAEANAKKMLDGKPMEKIISIVTTPPEIEEATTIPHPVDGLNEKHAKFEHVNYLLELLCQEMKIDPNSQPIDVLKAIGKVFEEYYKAKDAFTEMLKNNRKNGDK